MSRRPEGTRRVAVRSGLIKLLATAAAFAALPGDARAQVPPNEAWRTLATEHFRVTFPAHLEALGRSAGDRAELAYTALSEAFVEPPSGTIDILVTDHVDVSNGFAQYTPSNRITVYARPPVDDLALGYFDDWLELVITHELTHIVHLDRVGTAVGKLARGVFGRAAGPWPTFPGSATPRWVVEGIATWYESRLTKSGRVRGTFHEMVLRTAAMEGRFESIGQAGGESPQWPFGAGAYAYGSLFFDHLLDKYGEDRLAAFVDAVAGQWIPYRLNAAGKDAFGVSLSREWAIWADEARAAAEAIDERLEVLGPISEPETLTKDARWGLHPLVSPDGTALIYQRSDAKSDQQLMVAEPDGSSPRSLLRTNRLATFDIGPGGDVVFAQLEFADRYRAYSDIYVASTSGEVRRVTQGARLSQPTVGADANWAVAVLEGEGTTGLVRVNLVDGSVVPLVSPQPGVSWAFPALSADGRWIAATRWTEGAHHDVVILNAEGVVVEEVTSDRALDLAPDWSADGRYLVWASDRTGILNVLGASVDSATGKAGAPVMLTNMRTGASYPSVDPSGTWLYFSGYHANGWEVERVRFSPDAAPRAPEADARFVLEDEDLARGSAQGEVRDYSSFRTLLPTYWEPLLREPVKTSPIQIGEVFVPRRQLLGYAIGAQTGGTDLVGRHAYGAEARVFTTGGKAEGGVAYSYAGLGNPVIGLNASQRWVDDGARVGTPSGGGPPDTLFVLERDRRLSASVGFSHPTWRRSASLTFSGGLVWEDRELLDPQLKLATAYGLRRPSTQLTHFSASVFLGTARSFSFQMGGAAGASLYLRARAQSELTLPDSLSGITGVDRSADDLTGRVRIYLPISGPGYASHVLALQGSFGAARGPDAQAGYFRVGGASGSEERLSGMSLFGGSPLFFPVRGYLESSRFGRYAWSASAEYRVPLAFFNWGLGAWPLHFDRVIGSVFVDAGNAWGPDLSPSGFPNPSQSTLASAGAEITAQVFTFYRVSMRFRVGAAVPLIDGTGTTVYLRLGVPF